MAEHTIKITAKQTLVSKVVILFAKFFKKETFKRLFGNITLIKLSAEKGGFTNIKFNQVL